MSHEFEFVCEEHFFASSTHEEAKALFKKSVSMVEIEIFSYCNRRCWFCTNSQVDRLSTKSYMPSTLYTSIMHQLAEIDYRGDISYSRYNEPLSDKIILDRLKEARLFLPHSLLHTNTNGDYLTFSYLEDLYEAGLRSLNIQIYLQNEAKYNHQDMLTKAKLILDKLDLPFECVDDRPNEWLEYHLKYRDMSLRLYARNFEVNGCSRGDTLNIRKDFQRINPCIQPFRALYIDYNGKTVPCCNLRSDMSEHVDYIVHDLNKNMDIFYAYAQSSLVQWRQSLIGWAAKKGICSNCSFPYSLAPATKEELLAHEELLAMASKYASKDWPSN